MGQIGFSLEAAYYTHLENRASPEQTSRVSEREQETREPVVLLNPGHRHEA